MSVIESLPSILERRISPFVLSLQKSHLTVNERIKHSVDCNGQTTNVSGFRPACAAPSDFYMAGRHFPNKLQHC